MNKLSEVKICLKEKGVVYSPHSLTNPDEIVKFMQNYIGDQASEEFVFINLDAQLRPINFISFTGGIDACVFDIKAILKSALLSNAKFGMMFHNHPSGNDTPSKQDIDTTHKLKQFLEMLDIDLLDHVIYGSKVISLNREGLM